MTPKVVAFLNTRLAMVLFAILVFGTAGAVIYKNWETPAEQMKKLEQQQLEALCNMPLQPGEVETPRCEEYRAEQKALASKGGK